MSDLPFDHFPEVNPPDPEPWQNRLAWLFGACILFGFVGNAFHSVVTHGVNASWTCWLILALAVITLGTLVLWSTYSRRSRAVINPIARRWTGVLWVDEQNVAITLLRSIAEPEAIYVKGLPAGPIVLVIEVEQANRILARIQCADHGGTTGVAELALLPNNRIRLHCIFVDGMEFKCTFKRLKATTEENPNPECESKEDLAGQVAIRRRGNHTCDSMRGQLPGK